VWKINEIGVLILIKGHSVRVAYYSPCSVMQDEISKYYDMVWKKEKPLKVSLVLGGYY